MVPLEKAGKKRSHQVTCPRPDKLVCSEAVDFVAEKAKVAVSLDHLGVRGERRRAATCEMMPTIDFDYDSGIVRKQHQEVHALPGKRVSVTKACHDRWVVMKIDLRHQSRQSIPEILTEAPKIFVEEPAFCVRCEGDPQTLTEFAPRLLFRDLTMAMLLTPPINQLRPE